MIEKIMNSPLTLSDLLVTAEYKNFTGKVFVKSQSTIQWKLYFLLGKLIWINGGDHSHRSWLRHLIKFCPEINFEELGSATKNYYECTQYQTLYLLASKKIIDQNKVKLILESRIEEKFFDILQEHQKCDVTYTLKQDTPSNLLNYGFKPSLVIIDYHNILNISQQHSIFFTKSGLKDISLNDAPKVSNTQKLQEKVDLDTYSYFIHFFDGNLSLRDLGLRLNKNTIKLALSINTFVDQGMIKFEKIPDTNDIITAQKYAFQVLKYHRSQTHFAVACIDHSDLVHEIMNTTVTQSSGRYIAIKDEFQVITSLIECNPDLIFINVAMPVINGYELCSQIKRVAKLNQIPIIMVSKGKSIPDRVRTKLVGASDWIIQPIDESKITKTLKKFISKSTKSEKTTSSALAFS